MCCIVYFLLRHGSPVSNDFWVGDQTRSQRKANGDSEGRASVDTLLADMILGKRLTLRDRVIQFSFFFLDSKIAL